jgi:hypothetical protein
VIHAPCLHSLHVGILLWRSISGRMDAYSGLTEKRGERVSGEGGREGEKVFAEKQYCIVGRGLAGKARSMPESRVKGSGDIAESIDGGGLARASRC